MYATHAITSLTAGELSPWMGARIDLEQYANGAARLENFVVRPYGGLERRSGCRWVAFAKEESGSVRLFAFKYAMGDQFMLEVGLGYVRFFTPSGPLLAEDGSPYEVETPWNTAEMVRDLRLTQVNDVIYCVCPQYRPCTLSRYADLDWRLADCAFSPYPRETLVKQTATMRVDNFYDSPVMPLTLVCSEEVFTPEMDSCEYVTVQGVRDERVLFQNGVPAFTGVEINGKVPRDMARGERFFQRMENGWMQLFTVRTALWSTATLPKGEAQYKKDKVINGYFVLDEGYPFEVDGEWEIATTGTWNASWELWRSYDEPRGAYDDTFYKWDWECIRSFRQDSFTERKNWALSGEEKRPCFMALVCTSCASAGDLGKPVFRMLAGKRNYEFKITRARGKSADVMPCRMRFRRYPNFETKIWSFGAFGARNGYPRAVAMHQGRLWFAGTPGQPTTLRASAVDDFGDFGEGTDDDSPLSLTVASTNQNAICWICPLKQMLFGTTEGEWMVSASDSKAITATSVAIAKQSSVGSEPIEADAVENAVFFVQRGGSKLREISYKLEADGFTTTDMSLLSEHLTEPGIVEWTIQHADANFIWVVVKGGTMAVLTHYPDQKVVAWHRHSFTGARVEHIASMMNAENTCEDLWMVTRRNVGGVEKRCIEVFSREGAWLDGHILHDTDAYGHMAFLPHLPGSEVEGYEIGNPASRVKLHTDVTGAFSFPKGAKGIWAAGLPYRSLLETMPFDHVEYFDSIVQQAQFKIRLLESDPEFDYKLSHAERWERYDASRDKVSHPFTGSLRLAQIPSPHSPVSLCLSTSSTGPFQLLSLSVELGYHGK